MAERMPRLALSLVLLLAAAAQAAGPFGLVASRREDGPRRIAAAPDGTLLAVAPGGAVRLDPTSLAVLQTYTMPAPDDAGRGDSVAAVGDGVLVGLGYTVASPSGTPYGIAYLFDGATGAVRHVFTSPMPPSSPSGNAFGLEVAALGDDVLVAAFRERAVHLFDGGSGSLIRTFADPGPGGAPPGSALFGTAIATFGDDVLVSAPVDHTVWLLDGATGAVLRQLDDPRPDALDYTWGSSLAVAGSDVFVGAPGGGSRTGGVYRFDGGTGVLLHAYLRPDDPILYNVFGRGLAVAGGRLLAGDPAFGTGFVGGDDDPDPSVGIVWVFDVASGALLQEIPNPTPLSAVLFESEAFGTAIAALPDRIVVADPEDLTGTEQHGGLYLYADVTACGDGALGPLETCDDGNTVDGDGCDSNCTPTACGNGIVTAGEGCDDANLADGDGCDSNCTATACGNGVTTAGEECDDGNTTGADGCSPTCTAEVCGNGTVDPGEDCDDGNLADGDACSAECRREPRDYFTCYRVRPSGASRRSVEVVTDAFGTVALLVGRPTTFCQGDGLTAPAAQLTCYRVKPAPGAGHAGHRRVTVDDATGTRLLSTSRERRLCLPSTGSRVFRLAHTFTDPVPPGDANFGAYVAGAAGRVLIASPSEFGNNLRGAVFVFSGETGALEHTLSRGLRGFGSGVADGGGGELLVGAVDDNQYLYDVASGALRRTFVGPGSRTPVNDRPIVAFGPYVLSGDPNNHSAAGASFAGAVHVFDRATGAELETLVSPAPTSFTAFGQAVATLGGQALIAEAGRTFLYDPATWTIVRELPAGPEGEPAVAGIGRRVLIGATFSGMATLFDADTGGVVAELHDDLGGADDRFGASVAASGGDFLVGAPRVGRLRTEGGVVDVYDAATGARRNAILSPDLSDPGFGRRVAALGDDVIVSQGIDFSATAGRVHLFRGGPLDTYKCYGARVASGRPRFAPRDAWIADAFAAGSTRLRRPNAFCNPAAAAGDAVGDPDGRLVCYRVADAERTRRQVTVENALGTETLTLLGRRTVCLPATPAP
jgi:cysteine-rich repeat protein